jgi:hypothetical protein
VKADLLIAAVSFGGLALVATIAYVAALWRRPRGIFEDEFATSQTTAHVHRPEYADTHRRICEAFDLMGADMEGISWG